MSSTDPVEPTSAKAIVIGTSAWRRSVSSGPRSSLQSLKAKAKGNVKKSRTCVRAQ